MSKANRFLTIEEINTELNRLAEKIGKNKKEVRLLKQMGKRLLGLG